MPVGSLPESLDSRRIDSIGTRQISITASDATASGHGRLWTVRLQRRQAVSRGGAPLASRRRSRRPGRTTRSPQRESSAGRTVSDALSTSSTASTEAIASPYMKFTPVANIPSSAITTVVPASRIARPEVSIAPITASVTSAPFL